MNTVSDVCKMELLKFGNKADHITDLVLLMTGLLGLSRYTHYGIVWFLRLLYKKETNHKVYQASAIGYSNPLGANALPIYIRN